MTNPNSAAQAAEPQTVLTDDEIMRSAISACDSLNITRFHEIGAPSKTIMDDAGLLELGRAIETAVLSKLRAPVADDTERGLTSKQVWWAGYRAGKGVPPDTPRQDAVNAALRCRKCGEQANVRISSTHLVTHRPDGTPRDERDIASDPEGKLIYDPASPLRAASSPVAGEAKNYPGDNVAERLDKMADGQPPGSQAQSDLYAAATIWRKHIAHRAAPQASAENVRNAALEEAAKLMDQTLRSNGAALIRGLKRSQAHKDGGQQRAGDAALARLAEPHTGMRVDYQGLLRQAREGLHDSPGLAEMLRQLQGHLRELGQRWYAGDTAVVDELLQLYCVESNARAALSAPQAEQGERDAK